jgi:hypothetical protein
VTLASSTPPNKCLPKQLLFVWIVQRGMWWDRASLPPLVHRGERMKRVCWVGLEGCSVPSR